jgi:hypothetical protein
MEENTAEQGETATIKQNMTKRRLLPGTSGKIRLRLSTLGARRRRTGQAGVANLVVWRSLFERRRRVVFSAGIMAVGSLARAFEVACHADFLSADVQ